MNPFSFTGLASMTNAVQAGASSAAGMSNLLQNELEKKAKTDLLNMSVNLEAETNDFINELFQSNDYENWQAKTDAFLQKKNAQMQMSSKNAYTAKAADEMLKTSRNAIMQKVNVAAIGKMQEMQNVADADTKNKMKQLYHGQALVDQLNGVDDMAAAQGRMSPEQLYTAKLLNANSAFYEEQTRKADSLIDAAIAAGKGVNSILAEMDKAEGFKVYSGGKEITVDYTNTKEKVKKYAQQQYAAKLSDVQTQNEQRISQFYTNIDPLKSNEEILLLCAQGRRMVQQMGGYNLENGRQKYWFDAFNSIEKLATAGTGKNGDSVKLDAFSEFIKNTPDTFIEKVKDGTIDNLYDAAEILQGVIKNDYYSKDWKETKNMTAAEKDRYYQENLSSFAVINLLNNKQIKQIIKDDFPDIQAQWDAFVKDYEKDLKQDPKKRKYTENAANYISDMIIDTIKGAGYKGDKAEISKKIQSNIAAVTMDGLNSMFKKGKGEKALLQNTAAFEDNDTVYTDPNGNERWAPGTKEKFDEIAGQQKNYLEDTLGVSLGDWTTKKVANDAEPIAQFRDKQGNDYYLQTERDKNGKAKNLVIYKNGNKISADEIKQIQKQRKNDYKTESARLAAEAKQAKENTVNQMVSENAAAMYNWADVRGIIEGVYTQEQWEAMSDKEKAQVIAKYNRR